MIAEAGGVTLGELAEIGGVVVGIFAVVLGPLLLRVRRHRVELDELRARIVRAERIGELVCGSVARGLLGIDNTLDCSAGILHRLWLGRGDEVDVTRAIEDMRTLRVAVERAVVEVRLLAGAKTEQVSALQQLTYRLGDSRTVGTFGEAAKLKSLGVVSCDSLKEAQRVLTERLINGSDGI